MMNITSKEFGEKKQDYEKAIRARAEQIRKMRDVLDWSFTQIGEHFKITRQAAEKIYRSTKDKTT